jgi:hypothetical protein
MTTLSRATSSYCRAGKSHRPLPFPTRVSSLNTIGQLGYEVLFLRMGPLFIVGAVFLLAYSVLFLVAAGIAADLRRRFR